MRAVTYGSICSGIEAASVAWEPLGWKPVWFAEIEPFPCAVLNSRWPQVPNLGDMTAIAELVDIGVIAPEIIVGGTPCQAFSVAGLRNGLDDERGQLTLSYVDLADAIDDKRRERGEEEAIFVWENVPGVLSSKDNAFGCFIGALAGEECELQPSGGKWTNAGCVYGPSRVVAWRVLDAQFFGVAQRRRRVFVVASARSGFDPAAVLFEFDGVHRDTPPSREAGAQVAALTANGVGTCGADDNQAQAGHLITSQKAFRMTAFGEYADDESASTVKARDYKDATDLSVMSVHGTQDPDVNSEIAHTIGRNQGQENALIAFSYKDHGGDASVDLSPTIRAGNHDTSHANSGHPPAIAYAFKGGQGAKAGGIGWAAEQSPTLTAAESGSNLAPTVAYAFAENERGDVRFQDGNGLISGPLTAGGGKPGQGYPAIAIAGNTIGRTPGNGGNGAGYHEEISYTLTKTDQHGVAIGMQVRRLTPIECERLQGFPDNHTLIGWRGKAATDCPDGPRYKAIGNSMAVPVMRWIGQRIAGALK